MEKRNKAGTDTTLEELKKAIEQIDKIRRPLVVFMNPEDAKAIEESLPDIEERVVLKTTPALDRGKCYAVKREFVDDAAAWLQRLARPVP